MALRDVMTGGRDGASGAGTDCSLTLPAGCVAGDVAVVITSANLGAPTASFPEGWTVKRDGDVLNANNKAYVVVKTLDAADITTGTVAITWSASGRTLASGVVLKDVVLTDVDVTYSGAGTLDAPEVTTTVDGCDVIILAASRTDTGGAAVSTYPAGYTKATDAKTTFASGVNTANSIALLDTPGVAGTYGGGTISYSVTPSSSLSYAVALQPVGEEPPDDFTPIAGETLQHALQRLSDTTLDAQGAANDWAGTTGLELLAALNHKNSTTGLGLLEVLNDLAGTEHLGQDAAASNIEE